MDRANRPSRGVNLGGWLLLERWITPSLFAGLEAGDEYSFCVETRGNKQRKLEQHRQTFITKDDFEWLSKNGINSLRIPVGYWALEDDYPYVNCKQYLDSAFEWADELGFGIVLDLHGAPGSQNGRSHSGKAGLVEWTDRANIERTIEVIGQLAENYSKHESLRGISLLNEPGWDIPLSTLQEFYLAGYAQVRSHCKESVAVIISDAFRPLEWNGFMLAPDYKNVALEMHLYQLFSAHDKALGMDGHLQKTRVEWNHLIENSDKPVIVGEWSLALDKETFVGMDNLQTQKAIESYADAQLEVFGQADGWFFWTYKTENSHHWDFRQCVKSGLIRI